MTSFRPADAAPKFRPSLSGAILRSPIAGAAVRPTPPSPPGPTPFPKLRRRRFRLLPKRCLHPPSPEVRPHSSEVAYVLGQLQNKAASDALSAVLKNVDEHPTVRHEAAEALGSIADQESIALLEEFAKDAEPIVSQSCEVALSMLEYEEVL